MIEELCDICRHSEYDYEIMSIICNLGKEKPKYLNYCDKIDILPEEKEKLQFDFISKMKKQTKVWRFFTATRTFDLDNSVKYLANSDKLELKNNRTFYFTCIIGLVFITGLVVYFLIENTFEWLGLNHLTFVIFSSFVAGFYFAIKNLVSTDIKLIIDSNGIDLKTNNKFIPWELMFNVFVTEHSDSEGGAEYYLHIWSLLGDFKISLHELDIKITEITNFISYYKNENGKFNKLGITHAIKHKGFRG